MRGLAMTLPETIDLTVLVNLLLSITIVVVSLWGYHRIGKPTPLYFGAAYVLFAVSHLVLLTGAGWFPQILLIPMRIGGYLLVAIGLFALLQEILDRQRAEESLKESEEHQSATFEQTAVGIVEFLPGDRISRCNRTFARILGSPENELVSRSIWDVIPPDDHLLHFRGINEVLRNERREYSGEMLITRNDGTAVWCQALLSAVRAPDLTPKYFILVIADITDRKRAEEELFSLNTGLESRIVERTQELERVNRALVTENNQRSLAEDQLRKSLQEKEVLIKEIHHRVKNNLQIIVSLLFLQAAKTGDPTSADALMDSQTRVKSMALVHEKLYQSADVSSIDFQAYLQNLVSNLMVTYGVDQARIRVTVAAEDLPLTINTAIPLGLIMNEMVSNSLKYAFPDNRGGELCITGQVAGKNIIVSVRDNGCGIPESLDWKHAESLGLHLVQMLTRQLRGTVELIRIHGTEFVITIPVKQGDAKP
jgi:PAS domain S-box-containing protein